MTTVFIIIGVGTVSGWFMRLLERLEGTRHV